MPSGAQAALQLAAGCPATLTGALPPGQLLGPAGGLLQGACRGGLGCWQQFGLFMDPAGVPELSVTTSHDI